MSSKYNRFLLSTCLPVMAIGLCVPLTANAGFEWTPPEKTQPVEVTPAPEADMESMEKAVMPDPVVEEVITETEVVVDEEPPIEITVIEEEEIAVETPIEEEAVEIVVIEETDIIETPDETDVSPIEPSEEILIEQAEIEEEMPEDPVVEQMVHEAEEAEEMMAKEEVEEEPIIEVVESMDVESSAAPDKSESALTLNPYPLENAEQEQVVASVDPLEEHIQWNVPESFAVVEGFGKEMPLALALSQIVPAEYAYAFGEGVNPGMRVSWNGGAPWNDVLAAALEPHGVGIDIRYKKVLLKTLEEEQTAAVEPAMEMPKEEILEPEFQNDVKAVEEQDVEKAPEIIEEDASEMQDNAKEVMDNAEEDVTEDATPEEAMNDALREVYGDDDMGDAETTPNSDPIELEVQEEEKASKSMIEELLEPIEVTAEEEAEVPKPDMDELTDEATEQEETLVERINVLDPGREESTQPNMSDTEETASDMQKKN